ncbi:MAG: histidine triad nucleotide-binding protein [Candidatus Pacebacteria bacterium]|nr:histidine triad nucleotide-binding protein [Candidatus Paceibacterota bacterium]
MNNCIFCKIIKKEVKSDLVYEDEEVIGFNDIYPKSPVHILVVPKKHIQSVNVLKDEDKELIGKMVLVARDLAKERNIFETGYRLTFNTGKDAGQTVDHIHLHLMGGKKLLFA